jgi:hypothetical protein
MNETRLLGRGLEHSVFKARSLLAVLAVLVFAGGCKTALAETRVSAIANTTTGMSTTARLNFAIRVPKLLYLRVGTPGAAVNNVIFTVTTLVPTFPVNNVVHSVNSITVATAVSDDFATTTDGAMTVALWTNNGTTSLSCSGAALTAGVNTLPLSRITVANVGASTLNHPGASLACTSSSVGNAGINNLGATWAYSLTLLPFPAAGSYTSQVTYTASQP